MQVVATKLALFVAGVVIAVVTGWAVGQATVVLFPNFIVPGQEEIHDHGAGLPTPVADTPEESR